MRHVLLARQERLFPDDLLAAPNARDAAHVGGEVADQQFRPEARRAQLGMGEVEIVLALHDVIGELVAEGEADANGRALGVDHVEADDLRLLAAVEREARADEIAARRHQRRAVALVEPFRLDARRAALGLAAFEA